MHQCQLIQVIFLRFRLIDYWNTKYLYVFRYLCLKGVDIVSTPRRDLAPPIEEDEEPESESQGQGAPLRQIENNISALLRGDIPIVRVPGTSIDDIYIFVNFLMIVIFEF